LYGVNAIPCVGDLLRLGPEEEGNAALDFFICNVVGVPNVGFIDPKPVKPAPGAVVTPNKGLGLSDGAGELRDSSGGGVAVNGLRSGFLFNVVALRAEVDSASGLLEKLLGVDDQAEGPAFACPNGDTVEAKDEKPLCLMSLACIKYQLNMTYGRCVGCRIRATCNKNGIFRLF
jgi:hypothetical protein